MTAVLDGVRLHRTYRLPRRGPFEPGPVRTAVDGVDLTVAPGQRLGIVGESGSGKSTLVRLLAGLEAPSAGSVTASGRPVVASGSAAAMRWFRRETGVVFQDPYASLDPRMRVGAIVGEPLRALRIDGDHRALVRDVLERVDLPADVVDRYPHEFSGGQRQRIAIARAVVHRPRILFGDEPMSALDVVVRARVIELFRSLADDLGLTMVLVSHDIGVVQRLCDTVAVMSAGRIVEHGPVSLLDAPVHPVTQALVEAAPTLP
ncbi:dipeptide/oligopeptide/nickel ABC transporter ATP-binding protein [Curtobacterium sp. MCJR17_020]|uniref:ABC transporter ATP-binding protein n=1 Tax=Curtobacterium sp. MCJR17_020 TaxID=2175619 RepID=UPI000DAABE09|nr:dipeptide/oligopeptide/nickel ABC transporter ATP-binding protein [Curtobacterium sp. MCJR17_020]WIE70715.1 dipeptide/oligopeptide/nickel ABC transporter ATP-binding protein [Curtobacterium sp. MCJR17_020]